MSNENVNIEFSEFGSKIKTIAILSLISFVLGIVGLFIIGVGLIGLIFEIIIIIFFLILFGSIKRAGTILNNENLLKFKPRFLLGTIIRFIGTALLSVGSLFIVTLGQLIILLAICVVLIILGSILRYKAWSGIESFFKNNFQLFPMGIGDKGRSGAKYCRIGSIFDMIIIIPFIGNILRVIGYFKLANLKDIDGAPSQPMGIAVKDPSEPSFAASPSAKFCHECGGSVISGVHYCPHCGAATL